MALLKFDSREECEAISHLLHSILVSQGWADVRYYAQGHTCHICGNAKDVKRGHIAVSTYFEKSPLFGGEGERFVFWQLCINCHAEGWVPFSYFNNGIRYSRPARAKEQLHEKIVENQPAFPYLLVVGLNTNSLLIS